MKPVLLLILFLVSMNAEGKLIKKVVEYRDGADVLEGYLAYEDSARGKRPGVLVVHEWMGINDYVKRRADMLAGLGYVAFAADIYGKGVHPKNPKEAGELAGKFRGGDRANYRRRLQASLAELKKSPNVNAAKLAAIGYCFGGTGALEVARSGAAVAGVVSFHGALSTVNPSDAKNIKGKVLVLHGADDPYVTDVEVRAFEEEMRNAKVDWQLVKYANAVHAFTNPDAGSDNSKGAAYNQLADQRSWLAMKNFFNEIFR